MNRRKALKQLGILAGGITLLPSCDFSSENITRVRNKFSVTESQDELMRSLIDTIIPKTDSPGGLDLKLDDFVWVMIDDCLNEEMQASCLKGLETFDDRMEELTGSRFISADKEARLNGLTTLQETDSSGEMEDALVFLKFVKGFGILGFQRSEYVMKEEMPYALIPGKAPECELIDPTKRVNING